MYNKIFILVIFISLGFSCKNKEKATVEQVAETPTNTVSVTDKQLQNLALLISLPQSISLKSTLKVNGMVDVPPQSLFSVSMPLGGYLKSTNLLPGSTVKKGAVLAVMEDQIYVQLQQDFLLAKAKMEFLQADLQRQKELSDANAASKKNYQLVLSEFKMQQINIKALEEKLKIIGINAAVLNITTISKTVLLRSPIDGYVTKVNVNIGKYVSPTDVMFELVNPNDIHAAITVFEKDVHLIKKGMKGKVALADNPNKLFDVEVILVTQNVDNNRAALIHCHFENPNHDLLPGMFLTASLYISSEKVVAVSEDAIVNFEGKQYIFVAKDNKNFEFKSVTVGASENGLVAIQSLEKTDWLQTKIVTKNAYKLLGKLKNVGEEE